MMRVPHRRTAFRIPRSLPSCCCSFSTSSPLKDKGKAKATDDSSNKKKYSHTLLLPKTDFSPRAAWAEHGELWRDRTTKKLWEWQSSKKDRPTWVLHDGPPYANGHLHMGHALNKILKDFINRYKVLKGFRVHYRPGFDCHGLPIELKALSNPPLRPSEAQAQDRLDPMTIRRAARRTAAEGVALQKQEFEKFGILADWDSAWLTMDHEYEMRQLRIFAQLAASGFVHRSNKPALFSPSSGTALAEAEVEYRTDHVSRSVYVVFDVARRSAALQEVCEDGVSLGLVIWTTTPWTLAANQAVAINPHKKYAIVKSSWTAQRLIVATECLPAIMDMLSHESVETIAELDGRYLLGTTYIPVLDPSRPPLPLMPADYVTTESGTGLVHTAPSHGVEDFVAYRQWIAREDPGRPIQLVDIVNDEGRFRASAGGELQGLEVMEEGSVEVIRMLYERKKLLKEVKIRHKYPYDWRTKRPVITKTTPQWFADLEPIKQRALAAIQSVTFHPTQGRTRLEAFVKGRSEWCISRQRAWGVPIPVLYDAVTDEPHATPDVVSHILGILDAKGTDHWWSDEVNEFVPAELKRSGKTFRKGRDTLDVWFDSGCSWATIDAERIDGRPSAAPIVDLVLEGSDQHRGWFQSLLLTAVASQLGVAPFGTVVTHGFSLDTEGRKMSKSLGNVVSPIEVIEGAENRKRPAYGADVLRLWAASVDYTNDHPVGHELLQQMVDALKKIRITVRWLLGNLAGLDISAPFPVQLENLDLVDRYMLHQLADFDVRVQAAYDAMAFNEVMQHVTHFTNATLSAFYFDRSKDILYNDAPGSAARQGVVAVLAQILDVYRAALGPIVPHLVEELDLASFRSQPSSLARSWPTLDPAWRNPALHAGIQPVLSLREALNAKLDHLRTELKLVMGAAETEAVIDISDIIQTPLAEFLTEHAETLPRLFGMSDVAVCVSKRAADTVINLAAPAWHEHLQWTPPPSSREGSTVDVHILPAWRQKCPRCWRHTRETGQELCERCTDVVGTEASPLGTA